MTIVLEVLVPPIIGAGAQMSKTSLAQVRIFVGQRHIQSFTRGAHSAKFVFARLPMPLGFAEASSYRQYASQNQGL